VKVGELNDYDYDYDLLNHARQFVMNSNTLPCDKQCNIKSQSVVLLVQLMEINVCGLVAKAGPTKGN